MTFNQHASVKVYSAKFQIRKICNTVQSKHNNTMPVPVWILHWVSQAEFQVSCQQHTDYLPCRPGNQLVSRHGCQHLVHILALPEPDRNVINEPEMCTHMPMAKFLLCIFYKTAFLHFSLWHSLNDRKRILNQFYWWYSSVPPSWST